MQVYRLNQISQGDPPGTLTWVMWCPPKRLRAEGVYFERVSLHCERSGKKRQELPVVAGGDGND